MKSRSLKVVGRSKLKTLRAVNRRKIVAEKGFRCHWCGVLTDDSIYSGGSPRKTTIDHLYNKLDPRRRGQDNNVVVACEACNAMRARIHEFVFGQRSFAIKYARHCASHARDSAAT